MDTVNELFPFGNGRFIAYMQKLSINEIRAEHTSRSFCSLEYINTDNASFTKSQRIYNSSRWHTRLLKVANQGSDEEHLLYSAEIDDGIIDASDLFIRSFKNTEPLCYRLVLPEYAHLVPCPPVSYKTRHCSSIMIKIEHDNYEEMLHLTFCGPCFFNEEDMLLTVEPGRSAVIFSMGTIPMVIHKNASRALHLITEHKLAEPPIPFRDDDMSSLRNSVYALTTALRANYGIAASSKDAYIRMLPTYATVKLFNTLGMNNAAKALSSNTIRHFLSVKDCAAIGHEKEVQFATDIFSLVPSLLMLTALEAPVEPLLKSMMPFLTARLKIQSKALINGMLPFEGREYYYNNFCAATDGSAVSTLFYVKAAGIFCEHTNDTEISDAYNKAKECFRDNFICDSRIYLNSPKRSMESRLPKFIYGRCDFCGNDRFTWLIKNAVGAYCCDRCIEGHKSDPSPGLGVRKESYLPVFWSLFLELDIFTEDEIAYAQELALRSIDLLSSVDVALLLLSTVYRPHLAQSKIYDTLRSRRNSLDIWYEEAGELDTLTNAISAYAIKKTGLI